MSVNRFLAILSAGLWLLSGPAAGQVSTGGTPISFQKAAKAGVPSMVMPSVDVPRLLEEDAEEAKLGVPFRFGYPFEVNYNLFNSGNWEKLDDGSKLWRLRIECPGAYSINLVYDQFRLPEGARLFIYNEDHSMVIGAFTSQNNKPHGQFATAPVKGDVSILEYYVPADVGDPGLLGIQRVIHGYKNVFFRDDYEKAFGDAGDCNNNVHCPEGEPWADEIRSVAMITTSGGWRLCSGALINNARQDFRPYFLTAQHCLGGEETWVFIFNYESPTCENINGPTWMSVAGSTLRATYDYSDFALLELSETPPDTYNVFYAGWSRLDTSASSAVGIHHPSGDIKKISFDNNKLTSTDYLLGGGDSHWRVGTWDDGTTEGGSSGSPLFDPAHHIVGQLHGGYASCEDLRSDWYGKFSKSWDYDTTSATRLRDWLDPDNTGVEMLDGLDPRTIDFTADTTMGCAPMTINFTGSSILNPESWDWDFGDGGTGSGQTVAHLFENPGPYDITLSILASGKTYILARQNYIRMLADTVIGPDIEVPMGVSFEVTLYGHNYFPLSQIKLPVEYSGTLPLVIDSFSTAGCRTDYFVSKEYSVYDSWNKRVVISLRTATDGSQPELSPGGGDIVKVYFTVLETGLAGQSTVISLDGYDSYLPTFSGSILSYSPWVKSGSVTLSAGGCCIDRTGNVDGLGDYPTDIDIADLVYLVAYMFDNGVEPPCLEEANIDGLAGTDIADLVYLVDFMFGDPPGDEPVPCP